MKSCWECVQVHASCCSMSGQPGNHLESEAKKLPRTVQKPADTGLSEGDAGTGRSCLPQPLDKAAIVEAAASDLCARQAVLCSLTHALHRIGHSSLLAILEHVIAMDLHICRQQVSAKS